MTEQLYRLRELNPNAAEEELSAESCIGLDCDVVITYSPATDAKIVPLIFDPNFENDDNEAEDNVNKGLDDVAPPRPSDFLLEDDFETLQNALLYSPKNGSEIRSLALKHEEDSNEDRKDR